MNGDLDGESYARAALTYLAEPADRWLNGLILLHGASRTLEAIRSGRLPDASGGAAIPRLMQRAMERWRVRLDELPTPDEVIAFRTSGIRLICPGDPEWPEQLADLGDEQPYALWLRGTADLRFNCLRSVAMVGSRAATAYGSSVAAEFAASGRRARLGSGLRRRIDDKKPTSAHGPCIAPVGACMYLSSWVVKTWP